ncbi:MAG: TetR/AcrR family transcriptional regulator [Alphaproteobacteria bacterium]|nr:TetR/AcrR family transcriptional regulator [Alphaproteobacteria bacterium]
MPTSTRNSPARSHPSPGGSSPGQRPYVKKRRAAQEAATRQRIVDAAVDLHRSIGPAQTSLSRVAKQAGVQRHTLYAHFPDEWSLLLACSAEALARSPLPDPEPWRRIEPAAERLRTGLAAVWDWYARNADLAACVLRDAESHAPTREIVALRLGPTMAACAAVLGEPLSPAERPMLALALSHFTWRTLVRDTGTPPDAAVEAMVRAIRAQA